MQKHKKATVRSRLPIQTNTRFIILQANWKKAKDSMTSCDLFHEQFTRRDQA